MVGSEPHYAGRAPECGLGRRLVAPGEIQQQVAGNVLMEQRRAARERRARRDFRVRTVRAQEMPAGLPGQVPVGDVTPAAFEHALVFEPALVAEWLHSRGL